MILGPILPLLLLMTCAKPQPRVYTKGFTFLRKALFLLAVHVRRAELAMIPLLGPRLYIRESLVRRQITAG